MGERTIQDLYQLQGLPLNLKIRMTKDRIRQWIQTYGESGVYVSFSGGKDSTVLLHLVREDYPDVKAVFVDTGLEYPEIRQFVKTFDNVDWIKPKMNFKAVIQKYGYPFISKEVSECVYGARRYLTSVLEQASLDRQTDRQTDRQSQLIATDSKGYADLMSLHQQSRGGADRKYRKARGIGEFSRTSTNGRNSQDRGTMGSSAQMQNWGGAVQPNNLQTLPESERLKTALSLDSGATIDNFRIQRMMGILPLTGKATAENIPSKADRSAFSCVRYQFFLDAPFEISNACCSVMKKAPAKKYQKETGRVPMTAQMASESRLRTQIWLKQGCNAFDAKKPVSNPMAFWTEQDVLLYIYQNHLPICSVYGDVVKDTEVEGQLDLEDIYGKELFDLGRPLLKTTGCNRTGCMFCGYGCQFKGDKRFERMKVTHPKQYEYIMKPQELGGLGYKAVIDWINEHGNLSIRY